MIKYDIRTSSFVYLKFFQKSKIKVRNNLNIRGGTFDHVNLTITMRPNAFEMSDASISYTPQRVKRGLLFFGKNRLSRDPIQTSNCMNRLPVYLSDKDIGAFGICKRRVNHTYVCTNAPNNFVTLNLDDTQFPEVAASTYVASVQTCDSNCSVCNLTAEVCQTTAPNTLNYWYGGYTTVSFFFNSILGLLIE